MTWHAYHDPAEGLEASRRVAWAKFYEKDSELAQAEVLAGALTDELVALADAVLEGHKGEAFQRAWRIRHGDVDGAR